MRLPYTNKFTEAVAAADLSVAAVLSAVLLSRPLRTPKATALLVTAVWLAAVAPHVATIVRVYHLSHTPGLLMMLQVSATLATIAAFLHGPRGYGVFAAAGQLALLAIGSYVRESDFELSALQLFWFGAVIGVHRARSPADQQAVSTIGPRSFGKQDGVIFAAALCLAAFVTNFVFERTVVNGDEIANTFQAGVYGHLRAYAPVPPCASMFENYWVFTHAGRVFSQYTPGWPLFMAPFERLGVVWLAGPTMGGVLAVGIARLSRRIAVGLGPTPESSARIVELAGFLGPLFAMLGPAMLLNAASRFPHTMVCACFAWAVESLCVISERPSPGRAGFGVALGTATALGVATRPVDGAALGLGVFVYFLWALRRGRLTRQALLGVTLAFAGVVVVVSTILRLQLGEWFKTGYDIARSVRPEAGLRLSLPEPNQLKFGIPLATGSYCWWPAAPALGIAGLIPAVMGRERRVVFMLLTGGLAQLAFYFFVEFGRTHDNGFGPRYLLPLVVPMAVGGAALIAPLLLEAWESRSRAVPRFRAVASAALATLAVACGVFLIIPRVYPLAHAEMRRGSGPIRAARDRHLTNAIVVIEPGQVLAHPTNLAQNRALTPDPDVLFLIRRRDEDEVCARRNFPGRTWYHAGRGETLAPY